MQSHEDWVNKCIQMAEANVDAGQMPFAAIVVKEGKQVAFGVNDGAAANDPTAHGEIRALQAAGKALEQLDLSGCVLYTNCEPCPMCLGAIYWSGIKEVYYGLSVADQTEFDELPAHMYKEFQKSADKREVKTVEVTNVEGRTPFLKMKQ